MMEECCRLSSPHLVGYKPYLCRSHAFRSVLPKHYGLFIARFIASERWWWGKRVASPNAWQDLNFKFTHVDSPSYAHNNIILQIAVTMDMPGLQRLAPPGVTCLVTFLAFSSQWLFSSIEPGPLRKGDAYIFNGLVTCLLICYWRSCITDPGRIPRDWHEKLGTKSEITGINDASKRHRWCRRCEALKPPRAHHCKVCKRYVEHHAYTFVSIPDT